MKRRFVPAQCCYRLQLQELCLQLQKQSSCNSGGILKRTKQHQFRTTGNLLTSCASFQESKTAFSFCQRQLLNARWDTYNRLPTALTDIYGSYLNPLKNRTIKMWSQKYKCADWYFSSLPFLTYFPSKNSLAESLASCNP